MHLRKEHDLFCGAEELWRLMFDPDFDKEHAITANRMQEHEVLSVDTRGQTWQLRSRSTPSTPIPKFIAQWIGPAFSYETLFTHQPGSRHGAAVLRASVMPERIHMSFRIEVIPQADGRCRRIMDWEVKIVGIGPIIEHFILKEIEKSLDASARFVDAFCQKGQRPGAAAQSAHIVAEESGDKAPLPAKLHQAAAEYNLTEHCNLKCAGCNHASHQMPKKFAVLTECQRDLMALAAVMHLDELKFVGGEPLLHPDLAEFLAMARQIGIADQITLVTNGVLLHKMPERIYSLIDRLWISAYPSVKLQLDRQRVESLCREHDVVLWYKETPNFALSLINRKLTDPALVQEIYSQCGYAHLYSCHTIYEGRYYKCSPAPFVGGRLALAGIPYAKADTDSVALHDNQNLATELAAYLADTRPLSACSYCLANLGRDIPSRQLNKAELARELKEDHEDLISLFHPDRIPAALVPGGQAPLPLRPPQP